MSSVEGFEVFAPSRERPLHLYLARHRSALLHLGAGLSYVAIGVFVTEFMLSWIVAFAWLLLWTSALPALGRRLLR